MLLDEAARTLIDTLKETCSEQVLCRRGDSCVEVSAVSGKTQFQVTDANGVQSIWQSHDWIVDAADYVFDGRPATPIVGDRVEWLDARGVTKVYEALSPSGTQVCEPLGANELIWRIHTKLVSTRE